MAARCYVRPLFCLLLLLTAITFPVLFLGFTTNAVSLLGPLPDGPYGYHGPRPEGAYTRDAIGSVAGDMADEVYTRDVLKNGELPFWNPYQGNGWPFLSDPSSKVFYPLNLFRLIIPIKYWDIIGISHLFLIGVFVFLFATACGLPRSAALLSGACAFSIGHFQINISATSVIQTETWILLVFYAVETAVGRCRRPFNWLVAAVATYGVATGGHPGPAIYGAAAVAIYALIRMCQREANWRGILALLPAVAAGALLAAPTWLNFLDFVRADVVVENMIYPALPSFLDLSALFMPYLFGNINTALPSSLSNWGIGYIPPAVAFLAVAASLKIPNGTRYPQLVALSATSIALLAWGLDAPGMSFLRQIPFLARLNPNYLWMIPSFAVCLAAGVGLSKLTNADGVDWRRLVILWGSFAFVILLLFAYALENPSSSLSSSLSAIVVIRGLLVGLGWMVVTPLVLYAVQRNVTPASIPSATIAVAFAAVTLSAVGYFPSGSPRGGALSACLAIFAFAIAAATIVFADRSGWAVTSWVTAAASAIPAAMIGAAVAISYPGLPHRYDPFTAPPFIQWLRERTEEIGARVYGIGGALFPNFASAYRISSINVLATSTPSWNNEFVRTYLDPFQSPASFSGHAGRPPEELLKRRRYWSYMGVKYVLGRNLPFLDYGRKDAHHERNHDDDTLRLAHVDAETAIEVWENDLAEPRLYVAPSWSEVEDWRSAQQAFGQQPDLRRVAFVERDAQTSCPSDPTTGISASVSNLKVNPNTISATIETDRGGVLTLVDMWMPGWTVLVNGAEQKSFRVNGVFRGACLAGPGRYDVIFRFEPPLLRLSLLLSGSGAIILMAVGWCQRRRRPIRADQSSRPG